MGRARHFARREGHRGRSSTQGSPQFLVFSAHPNAQGGPGSLPKGGETEPTLSGSVTPSLLRIGSEASPHLSLPNYSSQTDMLTTSGTSATYAGHASPSDSGRSPSPSSPRSQDSA